VSLKIVTIVGARPQFIKAAAVSRVLRERFREVLVHTGQHYDDNMSQVFFDELGIPRPDYNLGIGSGGHGAQTGAMLAAIEEVLLKEKPDRALVYGDTNSTLAGALAAVKLHVPVAHVEAGLRSFYRRMPEEINRVLTDHVADLLFCPGDAAVKNLAAEGIRTGVHLVGDVMYDATLQCAQKARQSSQILVRLGLEPGAYVLATVHRAENTDDPVRLRAIMGGLRIVSQEMPVVLPLHPRTARAFEALGLGTRTRPEARQAGLRLVDPAGYLDMMSLEQNAAVIATDSGGVQKEAYFHRVPCVTLRAETEWVELVDSGWNELCGSSDSQVVAKTIWAARGRQGREGSWYGDGHAASRIADILEGRSST
jgi:UDP-GlcNAc3NAcA epimerase